MVAVLAALLAVILPAAKADAAAITITGGTLTYQAAPGESNNLTITSPFFTGKYYFTDTGATSITVPSPTCTVVDGQHVNCPMSAFTSAAVNLDDGNDSVDAMSLQVHVTLNGGAGDDSLRGGQGNDTLNGDGGNDTLRGTGGADTFSGGDGTDTVTYSGRTTGITASMDGVANDGDPGENDNVQSDVENLVGTSGNDTLTGSDGANTLEGGPGNDTLDGGAGDDTLIGGLGADSFSGGEGVDTVSYADAIAPVSASIDGVANDGLPAEGDNVQSDVENLVGGGAGDTLTGDDGANSLDGGPGNDTLDGHGGADVLTGGTGDDTITSRDDAVDQVACGDGADVVTADRTDVSSADCETVALPDPLPPVFKLPHALPLSLAKAEVGLPVGCPKDAGSTCAGSLVLSLPPDGRARATRRYNCLQRSCRRPRRSRHGKVGSRRFTVAVGHIVSVRIHLDRYAQWRLRRYHKLKLRATLYMKKNGRSVRAGTKDISLRLPRHRGHR
jgi:hypothetical protein